MRYLTTNKLIELIALKAALPLTQVTFTEDNFLSFINEQMDMHIIPHIKSFHEDYLIVTELIPTEPGVYRYAIPNRAVGNALRDVCYTEDNRGFSELTRIHTEDVSDFSHYGYLPKFYVEAGEIVLHVDSVPTGFLRMAYYARPNEIVSENNAAVVTSISKNKGLVFVDKAPEVFNTNQIYDITSSKQPHKLIALNMTIEGMPSEDNLVMTFGTAKSLSLTLSNTIGDYVNSYITIKDSSGTSTVDYVFYFGTAPVVNGILVPVNITGLLSVQDILITLATAINTEFSDNLIVASDVLNNTITISNGGVGVSVGDNFEIVSTLLTNTVVLSPGTNTIPKTLIKNDVIALAEQTIIPQVPSELHPMLAQGCAMRCLETLGDTQGLQNAAAKFAEMEQKTAMLINNRVEAAPQKVNNRHSLLRKRITKNRG